jgi:hypothetical protein
VIRAHETEDHKERNGELRVALNETLIALAAEGITDASQWGAATHASHSALSGKSQVTAGLP